MRSRTPWLLVLLSGVITALVGFVIVSHWQAGSLYIQGLFPGIDLVVTAAGWVSIGPGLQARA